MTKKSSFYSLLFTIFNDAIGWGIVVTIFAPLIFDYSHPILPRDMSEGTRNVILGFLIGSYAITQFVSMPLIGALSDHFGRKRILEWTILGAMLSFILSAFAIWWKSIEILFLARLLSGLFSGNAGTANASIADMSTEKTKAKNLSIAGIVGGISWILGPPLGGFLSTKNWVSWFDFSTPFWFLAILFLINLIWVNQCYIETYQKKEKHDWKQEIRDLRKLSKIPRMKGWLTVSFLFDFGWFFFVFYYPTLFVQKFHFNQEQIGYFSAYMAIFWFLASLIINKWQGELSSEKAIFWSVPITGAFVLIGSGIGNINGWIITFPIIGIAATTGWINTMAHVSNLSGKENQGKAFGVIQSMMSLALFAAPFITGLIAIYNIEMPIYIGGIIMIGVGIFAFGLYRKELSSAS